MLNQVIWPEFSRRYGEKADQTMRKRYRHGTAAPSGGATLLHFAESFLKRWEAHGKVACVPGFLNLLMIVIARPESCQVGLSLCVALPFVCLSVSWSSKGAAFLGSKHAGINGATAATMLARGGTLAYTTSSPEDFSMSA
ncbi:hypothetical protein AWB69_01161 [Caballeronia udeis]|uniref:Uncharacterized protein n=2 Tax=Caballeronia udeis TaxID=1232866 RepID=A0A158FGZ2_9BURK|nr:hypothetical protein AWB69_01161 [Caballeronia udeis]